MTVTMSVSISTPTAGVARCVHWSAVFLFLGECNASIMCLHAWSHLWVVVEFWGLPPLISLLQCVNRLGFEICSVNSCQSEQGSLVTLI